MRWPAGGLPTSANLSGAPLDTTGFRFAHQVHEFPGLVFKGNGECSPHSTYDYLSVRTVLVPMLEREAPAIRVRAVYDLISMDDVSPVPAAYLSAREGDALSHYVCQRLGSKSASLQTLGRLHLSMAHYARARARVRDARLPLEHIATLATPLSALVMHLPACGGIACGAGGHAQVMQQVVVHHISPLADYCSAWPWCLT